jgi:hypothetical protein
MNAPLMHPALLDHDTGLRLDAGANGIYMTAEEFEAINDWDENYRYELIEGVVVVNPAVSTGEADPNDDLGHLLRSYQDSHPNGHVLDLTVYERDVRVGNNTIRRCDRAIWIGQSAAVIARSGSASVATLTRGAMCQRLLSSLFRPAGATFCATSSIRGGSTWRLASRSIGSSTALPARCMCFFPREA